MERMLKKRGKGTALVKTFFFPQAKQFVVWAKEYNYSSFLSPALVPVARYSQLVRFSLVLLVLLSGASFFA